MLLASAYGKIGQLLQELSDNDDDDSMEDSATASKSSEVWFNEFHGYLNSKDQLGPGMSIVQWWGGA